MSSIVFAVLTGLMAVAAAVYVARPIMRGASAPRARMIGPLLAIAIGAVAFAIYAVNGEPSVEGRPYAAVADRVMQADPRTLSVPEQELRLREMIRRDPDDADAMVRLGALLSAADRHLEAVATLERAVRLEPTPQALSALGQGLVMLNEGEITAEARRAFEAAHEQAPGLAPPAFFLAQAAYDAGDRDAAFRRWADLLSRLDAEDPYRRVVATRAADLLSRPVAGPIAVEGEGAAGEAPSAPFADMTEAEAEAMIQGMMNRLETRLEANPDDVPGWLTLARARSLSGDRQAAEAAVARAAAQADGDGERAVLSALARALEIELEETEA